MRRNKASLSSLNTHDRSPVQFKFFHELRVEVVFLWLLLGISELLICSLVGSGWWDRPWTKDNWRFSILSIINIWLYRWAWSKRDVSSIWQISHLLWALNLSQLIKGHAFCPLFSNDLIFCIDAAKLTVKVQNALVNLLSLLEIHVLKVVAPVSTYKLIDADFVDDTDLFLVDIKADIVRALLDWHVFKEIVVARIWRLLCVITCHIVLNESWIVYARKVAIELMVIL